MCIRDRYKDGELEDSCWGFIGSNEEALKGIEDYPVSYTHLDVYKRQQLGLFYESRYNNEAVCVFVGRDDTGTGRFACVRGIAGDLKKDISGSDKRFSFC